MPYLVPPTLTRAEQETPLRVSFEHPPDYLIFSLALGTGLRLSEIVGLNIGDVFTAGGNPRSRIRLRKEIAKGGRARDVLLPDALAQGSWSRLKRQKQTYPPDAGNLLRPPLTEPTQALMGRRRAIVPLARTAGSLDAHWIPKPTHW